MQNGSFLSEAALSLFVGERPFRHAMNLRPAAARAFYSGSDPELLARRQTILKEPYRMLTSPAGEAAHREFRAMLNTAEPLEPDLLFVLAPDWTLGWAEVCFPTHWSLEGKLGKPLADIHGVVPELNSQLGAKIGAFLDRLTPGQGWARSNWGLCASPELDQHPTRELPRLTNEAQLEDVFLRVEHQHLQKLPDTGAVAFGIRIEMAPLGPLLAQPDFKAGLLARLQSMPAAVAAYKGIPHLRLSSSQADYG